MTKLADKEFSRVSRLRNILLAPNAAGRNVLCLMEYGICKTNLKYLDTKNKNLIGNIIDNLIFIRLPVLWHNDPKLNSLGLY